METEQEMIQELALVAVETSRFSQLGVRKSGKAFERRPNNSSLFLILPKAGAACLR